MFAAGWKKILTLVSLGTLMVCVGCGSQESTSPSTPDDGQTQPTSAPTERLATPDETVQVFLQSLKLGDQGRATQMLTSLAQQEMARHEAAIQPPGSDTATFEVTKVELVGDQQQAAHVLSVSRDSESDGTASEHEIVWILRQEDGGWAIAGFATRVFPDQPPLVLNFEDPMDLQRKRSAVDAEIARRDTEQLSR